MSDKKKYQIDNPEGTGKQLRCPHCGEMILPQDLETWSVCPFCDGKLENTPDLEDFVVDPMVRQWAKRH